MKSTFGLRFKAKCLGASFDIGCMKRTRHPSYQKLEQFVLGRLGSSDDPVVVRLEEHLLVCPKCVNAAERTVEFTEIMLLALSQGNASAA